MARDDHTEPMPARRSSTQPLAPAETAAGPPTTGMGDRRLWVVAGVLALVLAFVAGYLVGRGGPGTAATPTPVGAGDPTGPVKKRACVRAVNIAQRALGLQARALANRAALAKATADGDQELVGRLNAELETIGARFDKVEARLDRFAGRCGA